MNPPYNVGGKIWDVVRKKSKYTVCLMPLSKYSKKNYRFVKERYKVKADCFDARFTYDIYITTCDGVEHYNWMNYEEFICSEYDDRFTPYYEFNARNPIIPNNRKDNAPIEFFSSLTIKEKRNGSVESFNEDTDFVTCNRCCGRDNNFSSINGIDYYWNYKGLREFSYDAEDPSKKGIHGLAYIKFPSNKSLKNFISFVYDNPKSKWLINNTMWGLNMGTVSSKCGIAIPQIDWESISDHPIWIEGKYDEAVLDVMGLKWKNLSSLEEGIILK